MASQSVPPMNSPRTVGYDDFVDERIQKTRSAVKSADLVTGVVTLLAWGLGLLLIAAAADHWLVTGGFDRAGRFALFAIGLIGALLYIATRLTPILLGKVNPLYAAKQIEEESPQLKNSLLNLLQLRGKTAGSPAAVQRTLERQAAEGLAAVGETTIDRSGLLRIARVVLALVAAIGVYVFASPKDFFASAGRVLAPWADIAAPSRVQISLLEPGDAELAQGERLEVSTLISGLRDGELVELVYSTRDGRVVDRRVPMGPRRERSLQHAVTLPPGGGSAAAMGLQGDLFYRVEAGDARTRNYRVEVLTAPTIAPVSVTYDYPAYTGYTRREVEGVGDLRAIEGTRVTLTAQANLPIDSAQIDLGADGRSDVRMKVDGEQATGPFTLRRDTDSAGDSTTSYVLRFTSKDNQANNSPPQYRVEILADLPPEASILWPEESTIDIAVNQRIRIEIEARDPDFALQGVRLVGEARGKRITLKNLLTKGFQGKFTSEQFVTPRDLGLQPGEVLEYWVEALDNKTPGPNRAESEHKRLRVVGPADDASGDPDQEQQKPDQGEGQRQPGDGADDPDAGDQGQPGSRGGGQSKDPSGNSESNPGEQSNQGESQEQPEPKDGDGKDDQEGEGRKPSPDGLRAPGEGGGSGEESDGQQNSGSGSKAGEESGSESGSSGGNGASSGGDEQQPSNQEGEPGESGDRSDDPNNQNGEQGDRSGEGGQNGSDESNRGDNQDGAGESEAPVPRNGEDDSTAFERIREFLKNQQDSGNGREQDRRQKPGDSDSGDSNGQNQPGRRGDPSERPQGSGERSKSDPSDSQEGSPNESGENSQGTPQDGSPNGEQQPREGETGEQPERPEEGAGPGEQDRSGQQSDSANSESGGDTPPGEPTDPQAGPRKGTGSSGQNQAADQGAGQSGDQGAGDSTGRPGSQQQADSPTGESGGQESGDGSQSSAGGEEPGGNEQAGSEASSEASGETGSDDPGSQESGGGEEGDQSSSEGSPQQGAGESADGNSGQSSNSESQGDQAGGEQSSGGAKPGDSPQDSQPNSKQSGKNGDGKAGKANGPPTGNSSSRNGNDSPGDGTEPGGDAANLEYAREQTELVLEELQEQLSKREVDRKLLDKLGWTEQDLRRFVERWQSRQQRAAERGPAGEAELDRALRNLGLGPSNAKATRKISEDQLRDLRQRARQAIPPRLRRATDAYNRSLNALSDDAPAASGE